VIDLTPPPSKEKRAPDRPPRPSPAPANPTAPKPRIVQRPIPFPAKRKTEMAEYAQRHYGINSYELDDPKVIVEHITVTPDFESVYNTFANDAPDPELNELPGTCSHYVVDTDGTIYQLVPLGIMCRHTVGLNHRSIGIENVAQTDAELLDNTQQLRASRRLTRWLACRYDIERRDVIGHNESLSSPYHEENVARLRTQTHGDMTKESMRTYLSGVPVSACA
jgi:beta-N-acetylhexosaminidase